MKLKKKRIGSLKVIFQNIDARFFYKIKISKLFKIFRFILYFDILYFQNELSVRVNFSTSTTIVR